MTAIHAHLVLNHFPLIGALLVALLLAWGLLRRSADVVRAALGLTVLLAVLTYPVVLSGESAEELAEDRSWAEEQRIHDHEELGEKALVAMLVTGGIALVALWTVRGERGARRVGPAITLAGLVVSGGLLVWTAWAGGQIRHDEIRSGSAPVTATGGRGPTAAGATSASEHERADDPEDR
jgi:hypothetical protein